LFLDYEEKRAGVNDASWVKAFCNRVKQRTGISCQIYTSASWARNYLNDVWNDLDVWLWEASWPAGNPTVLGYHPTNAYWFSPAQGMRVHQYSSSGLLPGYAGRLDMDAFYGTREEWTYREKH
jgi:lysozyme